MNRKEFIKNCGFACLGGISAVAILQSCSASKELSGTISGDDLIVSLTEFETMTGKEKHFKKYIIVQNERLKYPICIYRFGENEYSGLWMRCTHQGTELQVFGDKLQCPAHGSEFNNKGDVANGPAAMALRSFPISIDKDQLKISLKK
ncbi:Rieske [2Fe-2S] domain-containing protein [Chitinophaga sp. CF118]|uniref:QcrA and Rieske domain-containing protein n=1 Tax=Chitinophaga sp. CF118 TaxID=1884367 RepID=UPI0008EBCD02|nr:Rieske (2Fe-2S) protein [Chitinophaga sp. CF118]SFD07725.1 Rieske [2Fe-2S] domain-containing protein [Chitinophaga sp. CF118]